MFISPGEAFISIILPSGYTNIDMTFGNQDTLVVAGNRVDSSIIPVSTTTALLDPIAKTQAEILTGVNG